MGGGRCVGRGVCVNGGVSCGCGVFCCFMGLVFSYYS